MNNRFAAIRFFLLSIFLLLLSCVQPVRQKPPLQFRQAEKHNSMGIAAEARQKYSVAEAEFTEAYRLYSAVENYRGMVTALVNRSRLYRVQNDIAGTEKVLEQAVALMPHAPELEAEICFEMTKLALLKGDRDAAVYWSEKGVNKAANIDRARMLNLLAGSYFLQAEYVKAKETAESALKEGRLSADRREEANSLRLLGNIAFEEKRLHESQEGFAAALIIDKALALPGRISDDLRGLARTKAATGNLSSAADNYRRSASINVAERDFKRGAEDLEMLRKIYQETGNKEQLAATVELLEKVKSSLSNRQQR
jgi:tetratricopeptide (TPR) repeat protein